MIALRQQLLRFGSVGLLNTGVGLSMIFLLMFFLNVGPVMANVVGYAVGFLLSFFLNRSWTFTSTHPVEQDLFRYFLVVAVCYALNLGAVIGATQHQLLTAYWAQLLGVAVYTVGSFIGLRFLVFAPRMTA